VGSQFFDGLGVSTERVITSADIFRDVETRFGVAYGALADNGGRFPTVALLPDPSNPAVDAGADRADAPAFDARGPGFDRAVDLFGAAGAGRIDLGAYEIQPDEWPIPGAPVIVQAAGTGAPGEGPAFTVLADGAPIGTGRIADPAPSLSAAAFETFAFVGPVAPATLDIVFADDGRASDGTDVNLRIGQVDFGGQTYTPAVDGTYIRDNGWDLGPQRSLYWNGVLGFAAPPKVRPEIAVTLAGTGDATGAPAFRVLADGVEIGGGLVSDPAARHQDAPDETFVFRPILAAPPEQVVVEFLNDGRTAAGTDLNLIVREVAVDGAAVASGDGAVYVRARDGAVFDNAGYAWWDGAVVFDL
jgi:hypothetical protein